LAAALLTNFSLSIMAPRTASLKADLLPTLKRSHKNTFYT